VIKLALEHAFDSVVAQFAGDDINAVNAFGWRQPAQHLDTLPRIAWVPGDPSGALGELVGARDPGRHPRPLAQLNELVTVYITAWDPRDHVEDERAAYRAARFLYDAWFRAMYLALHGTFKVRAQSWSTAQLERHFGATIRVVFEVQAPIVDALPDEPLVGSAYAGLAEGAEVAVTPDLTMQLNDEVDT
jgi:hypothetical protein